MKTLKLPLYPIILCFTLGYIVSESLPFFKEALSYFVYGSLVCIGLLLLLKPSHWKRIKSWLLYGVFLGIGMVYYQNYYQLPPNHYHKEIQGKSNPTLILQITKEVSTSSFSKSFYAKVIQVNFKKTQGRILINHVIDSTSTPLEIGSTIMTNNPIKPVQAARNPGAFDYRDYLNNIRIYDMVQLKENTFISVLKNKKLETQKIWGFKKRINKKLIKSGLSDKAIGMLHALVLGNRKAIDKGLKEHYAQAGIIHVLAISGLHIGILVVFLLWVLRPLLLFPKGRWIRFLIVLLLLWGYAFFIGMSASVVRAVSMFSILTFSESLRRYKNSFHFLLVSFFILLVCYPPYLKEIGFQMSYLAVFGILWFCPILLKCWTPKWWVLKQFWQLTCVCLSAQLAVAPLSVYYFHQFPGLFLISNWVILPVFSLLLISCLSLTFYVLFFPIPKIVLFIFNSTVFRMNAFIRWVAEQESFIFKGIVLDIPTLLLVYVLIISLIFAMDRRTANTLKLVLMALIFLQLNQFFKRAQQAKINGLWVLHEHNNSVVLHQQNTVLNYYSSHNNPKVLRSFNDFINHQNIKELYPLVLENFFIYNEIKMLVIKDEKPYKLRGFYPTHIHLMNNPKINLERLLKFYTPKNVISDGSNAPWMTLQWKKTCLKKGISFHDTRTSGAYRISLETSE